MIHGCPCELLNPLENAFITNETQLDLLKRHFGYIDTNISSLLIRLMNFNRVFLEFKLLISTAQDEQINLKELSLRVLIF